MLALLLLLAAAEPDPSERAGALIAAADAAFAEGAFERAADGYLEARRILENTKVTGKSELLYNAGLAYDRAGRCDRAADLYHQFAEESPKARSSKTFMKRFEDAQRCAPEIVLETVPPNAQVTIDGRPRGPTPIALRLAHGRHDVELHLDGHQPTAFALNVEVGTRQRVERSLVPLQSERPPGEARLEAPPALPIEPPPPAVVAPIEPSSGGSVAPWIVGGAGVLAIGLGIAFAVLSSNAESDAVDGMAGRTLTRGQYESKGDDAIRFAWARNIAFGAGGAALAAAGVLWIIEAVEP